MIDKQEFYHGAAILRILEDARCRSVRKQDFGYRINEEVFVFPKYTTKTRSPWRFTFGREELSRLGPLIASCRRIVVALICGGDGICAVPWEDVERVLGGNFGWVSVRRNFNKRYDVAGPAGGLHRKISRQEWPSVIFEPGMLKESTQESTVQESVIQP